jgi:hypothetical protein
VEFVVSGRISKYKRHGESLFRFSLIRNRATDTQGFNSLHTLPISEAATASGLIHNLLGTSRTTSFRERSLWATSPRPSETRAGLAGALADTTPSSRSHCQKVWTFGGRGGESMSEPGLRTEVTVTERGLGCLFERVRAEKRLRVLVGKRNVEDGDNVKGVTIVSVSPSL